MKLLIPHLPVKPYSFRENLIFGTIWFCAITVFCGLITAIIATHRFNLTGEPKEDFLTLWNYATIGWAIIGLIFGMLIYLTCWISSKRKREERHY